MLIGFTAAELKNRMKEIRHDFARKWRGKRGSALRERLRNSQSDFCPLGKKPLPALDVATQLDHRIAVLTYAEMPISIEHACMLANSEENLQLVCQRCGKRKNAIDLEENPIAFNCDESLTLEGMEDFRRRLVDAGRKSGRKNVESGHLRSISAKGGRIGGRIQGPIQGRKNVESGHIHRLGKIAGRAAVESGRLARYRTSEHQAAAGRSGSHENKAKAAVISTHIRWHVRRGIKKSGCPHCLQDHKQQKGES